MTGVSHGCNHHEAMTTHTFFIPGKPAAWGIVLAGRFLGHKGGKPLISTTANLRSRPKGSSAPKEQFPKGWKANAVKLITAAWKGDPPITGPVLLDVVAVFPRTKGLDCRHKRKPCSCTPEKLDGRSIPHTSTPDRTNILKLAEDAVVAAGVIEDDRLVWGGTKPTVKRYAATGEEPGVTITVTKD